MRAARRAAALGAAALLLLGACAAGQDSSGAPAEALTLTVVAAASLTDVFEPIADGFEGDHPGVTVEMSFAASSTVVQQVNQGAGADVLALAGEGSLEPLADEHRHGEVTLFATNQLEIAVPVDNPGGVSGLDDLSDPGLTVVACAEQVPCGSAAAELFAQEGLTPQIASYEPDVRATLTKVELGEVDAGLVYRTDVAAAPDRVAGVPIPAERNVVNRYPALAVSDQELAQDFVDHLVSEAAQTILTDAGFGAAPAAS
ncbi:molybdate ABC transporter substrate-binding protein [Serinicoccus kebangsaanensis]|uniref:molybdate ABC transporter substrate-binding protein n=1 Tax=Serinicoccus kebangsaanensis TaxID=2602069 RepID=UPI00124C27C4|nr:molybdate ABC transporter substrate-binding protein [Serinicoccus kebangsaanensis]